MIDIKLKTTTMKKVIIYFLSMLVGFFVETGLSLAQEKTRSIELSPGMSYLKINDESFSAMTHQGTMFSPFVGLIKETDRFLDISNFMFQKGKVYLSTNRDNKRYTDLTQGTIDWMHLRKITKKDSSKFQFLIGGILSSSFTYYQREFLDFDDAYYLYQSSLGPAIYLRHPLLMNERKYCFESHLNFALLTYAVNPSYSSDIPERSLGKNIDDLKATDFIFGGKLLAINKFQRVNYNASILTVLNERTSVRFCYNWELIRLKHSDKLTKANHNLFLSLIFKY